MKRFVPTREQLLANRFLRPVAHYLHDDRLWHMERGSVARAVAIGVFFGFLIPVAQIVFAVIVAIALRSHVAIAAAATLVTNPLLFPAIYWAAYKVGRWLLGTPDATAAIAAIETQAEQIAHEQGWWSAFVFSIESAGTPLVVGILVFAVGGAILGFSLVWLLWRPRSASPAQLADKEETR